MSTPPTTPSAPSSPPVSQFPANQPFSILSVDLITKSAAAALLFIYGVGFVILGFHDAKYGVVQFSPFRARILLVGFVFVTLASFAAAIQHYGPGYFKLFDPILNDSEPKHRIHRIIIMDATCVLPAGFISSFLSTFIFHSVSVQAPSHLGWYLAGTAALFFLGFGLFVWVAKTYLQRPLVAVFVSLIAVGMVMMSLVGTRYRTPTAYLTVFLTLVGIITRDVKRWNNPVRYILDSKNWYLALFLIWVYINWVFSGMPPRWGGGQLTPVQVFQNTPVSWSPSNPIDALLLDESDQGYYVLLSPTGKAFFIPRSSVSSILFGSKEDLPKKP
jgi:hypothetical protein